MSRKYFQTHFVDAAYHEDTSRNVPNAHPPWAFSDGVTELYFDSPDHLERVFQSEWVSQKVGPDGVNFSDFSAVLPMFVKEDAVPLPLAGVSQMDQRDKNTFVAMYFVELRDPDIPSETLISTLVSSLIRHASTEVQSMMLNVPVDAGFDLAAYFGGEPPVRYQFVFTITLRGKGSIKAVRNAQADFEKQVPSLDLPATWIGFGERAVVLDQVNNIKVNRDLPILPGVLSLIFTTSSRRVGNHSRIPILTRQCSLRSICVVQYLADVSSRSLRKRFPF